MTFDQSPIEDYLDELLRRTRTDAHAARRLLEDATAHLHAAADELERAGCSRLDAEEEAIRRFGPVGPIGRATTRRGLFTLVTETVRAAVFLGACGLIAIGLSGIVAQVMNTAFGQSFVGGATSFPGNGSGPSVGEVVDDAVVLRGLAGLIGLVVLLGYLAWQRTHSTPRILPPGLVDALGTAAFAAATVALVAIAVTQTGQTRTPGAGFALSGAVVALPAAAGFATRAARKLLGA